MTFAQCCFGVFFLLVAATIIISQDIKNDGLNDGTISNETTAAYALGVDKGIINPATYTLESFERDERKIFKDLYQQYISLSFHESQPLNYEDWLVLNNFGILPDTQESLFKPKFIKRNTPANKNLFISTVKKGDILLSGRNTGGLIGHLAIMSSDYWVLEMRGGSRWWKGIPNNNVQLGKDKWYNKYKSDWIKVYRCPDDEIAKQAAIWADRNYFNPSGGSKKAVHITYKLTDDLYKINPSYDSKLVIQAYYFGNDRKKVVKDLYEIDPVIFPINIASYFRKKYKLVNAGEF